MKYKSFTSTTSVCVFLSALGLAGCATTGQSPTLAKYSDAEIKRCYNSLTIAERDEAARRAKADATGTALIPLVGPLIADPKEELYQEYERICLRKGVI